MTKIRTDKVAWVVDIPSKPSNAVFHRSKYAMDAGAKKYLCMPHVQVCVSTVEGLTYFAHRSLCILDRETRPVPPVSF